VQTIDIPYNHCHLNGVEFGWKVRGIRDQVIALLKKSKQPYVTQWVGLTEEEIEVIGDKVANENLVGLVSNFRVRLAKAIEQTLKERNT
jgi:hypothetical protein